MKNGFESEGEGKKEEYTYYIKLSGDARIQKNLVSFQLKCL